MKIVHISHHYIDGWGYQDNILPLYQQKAGNEVVVISDVNHLPVKEKKRILDKGKEYYDGNLKIYRINCFGNTTSSSLFCKGLYHILKKEKPDILFHHGVDSSTLMISSLYKKRNSGTVLFVDNHADCINKSNNKLWHLLYDKVWLSLICKMLNSTVDLYYGVSPLRCEYLHDTYHIPESKIRFLPLGGDLDLINSISESKTELRRALNIPEDSFVIVSGGKMGASKGTLSLIKAFDNYWHKNQSSKLLLFGTMDSVVEANIKDVEGIITFGWCDRKQTLSLLKMADVAVWPLLHTTLIEDAVACGIPLIVKKTKNVSHLEAEGCGFFLDRGDADDIYVALEKISNPFFAENARRASIKFSYSFIVKMIEDDYLTILSNKSDC